jgi:hypothetical protein
MNSLEMDEYEMLIDLDEKVLVWTEMMRRRRMRKRVL